MSRYRRWIQIRSKGMWTVWGPGPWSGQCCLRWLLLKPTVCQGFKNKHSRFQPWVSALLSSPGFSNEVSWFGSSPDVSWHWLVCYFSNSLLLCPSLGWDQTHNFLCVLPGRWVKPRWTRAEIASDVALTFSQVEVGRRDQHPAGVHGEANHPAFPFLIPSLRTENISSSPLCYGDMNGVKAHWRESSMLDLPLWLVTRVWWVHCE